MAVMRASHHRLEKQSEKFDKKVSKWVLRVAEADAGLHKEEEANDKGKEKEEVDSHGIN